MITRVLSIVWMITIASFTAWSHAPAAQDSFAPWSPPASTESTKANNAHRFFGDAAAIPGDAVYVPAVETLTHPSLSSEKAGIRLMASPLWLWWLVYSNIITKIDGPKCDHAPTCSAFGAQALSQHGLMGLLMTFDRMIRPANASLRALPTTTSGGQTRYIDPVSNYVFWKAVAFTAAPEADAYQNRSLPPLILPTIHSPVPLSILEIHAP